METLLYCSIFENNMCYCNIINVRGALIFVYLWFGCPMKPNTNEQLIAEEIF